MTPVKLLAAIAIVSALIAAVCLGAAYTLARGHDSGRTDLISRDIPWDGSTRAVLELPATMRYVQAPGPASITARGPHRSVSTLTVTNGHIHDLLLRTGAMLEITLTAPDITSFALNGGSRLVIEAYDQPTLTLIAEGAANIEASGATTDITIDADGYAVINLARLKVQSLSAEIDAAGVVIAAPQARANIEAEGFGTVILLTRPADLVSNLKDEALVIDAAP
jgi:hypothetical protein